MKKGIKDIKGKELLKLYTEAVEELTKKEINENNYLRNSAHGESKEEHNYEKGRNARIKTELIKRLS